jgi:FkbM family methyltransferase
VPPVAKKQPTRTFAEYFWCLKNIHSFRPDACVDVGAGSGTPALYSAFPEQFHILFEPLKPLLPALQKATRNIRHVVYNTALMDKAGARDIKKGQNLLTSTLMHQNAPRSTDDPNVERITVSTLDKVMRKHPEYETLLLKTDCQGADLLVLQGAIETLKKCEVVVVKCAMFRFWGDHQPDFYDVVHFMKQQDFAVHDFLEGLFRPLDRALGQIDVAFVKERGMFRKKRFW